MSKAMEMLKELGPWVLESRGDVHKKHYGTIMRSTIGNCQIRIWGTNDGMSAYEGEDAPSEREPEEAGSHSVCGGHYESVADYEIAQQLLKELNS